MAAKLKLENGVELEFKKSCGIDGDVVTVDGEKYKFSGEKIVEPVVEKTAVEEGPKRHKIYSGMLTPDGTLLSSVDRHDYVSHEDANGKHYMLDGGTDYIRSSVNGDEEMISVFLDDPIEKVREVSGRSGYGIEGTEDYGQYRAARLCEMSDDWVKASINYTLHTELSNLYSKELEYRKENNITIKDEGQLYHPTYKEAWEHIDIQKIK